MAKYSGPKTRILLLGPGKSSGKRLLSIRQRTKKELEKMNLGYEPILMDVIPDKAKDPSIVEKFTKLLNTSDIIVGLFFTKEQNVSVNFEIGFAYRHYKNKLKKLFILHESEKDLDLNPYISALTINVGHQIFRLNQNHKKPSKLIHLHILNT